GRTVIVSDETSCKARCSMSTSPETPTGGAGTLDLERFVPYQLSVLSNVVSQEIAQAYEGLGLAVTEWRVIAVLGRFPGLSAAGVAERSAMDKVAVSRAVASLLERGLLHRETHGDDRRRSVLELSEAGRKVHAEVAPDRKSVVQGKTVDLRDNRVEA